MTENIQEKAVCK